jgi:hypothetical protein
MVRLHFANPGKQPIIILKPFDEYSYDIGGARLSLTPSGELVYDNQAWRSDFTDPQFQQLGKLLDSRVPPSGITEIIGPGQTWDLETSFMIRFHQENTCEFFPPDGVEIGWKEIRKLHSPLWMRLILETWPNVGNFKKDFAKQLKKRWSPYGVLVGAPAGRYWFARMETEPIIVDLSQIR